MFRLARHDRSVFPNSGFRHSDLGRPAGLQRSSEPAQSLSNLGGRPGCESEKQSRRKFRPDAEERERTDLHAQFGTDPEERSQIVLRTEPRQSMQAGIRDLEGETVA